MAKEKAVHPAPKTRSQRETENFTDPKVPLGKGKWRRASECTQEDLTRVVAFLEKNAEVGEREGVADFNRKVLTGAKAQLAKKIAGGWVDP